MSVSRTILETKNKLIEVINQCGLPVSVSKYCLKDVLDLVEKQNDLELAVENRVEQLNKKLDSNSESAKPDVTEN
jgi:hypothetical protein